MYGFQMFFFGMILLNVIPVMSIMKNKTMSYDVPELMSKMNQSEISFIKFSMTNGIIFVFSGIVFMLFGI